MFKRYFIIVLTLNAITSFSQSSKIDSLKNIKATSFETYNSLALEYSRSSPDSLQYYNELSKGYIKTEQQRGKFLTLKASYFFLIQDFNQATKIVNQAIAIATKVNDNEVLGSAYNTLSKIKNIEGNFDESEKLAKTALYYTLKSNDKPKILKSIINYGSTLLQNNKASKGIKYFKLGEKYFYKGSEFEQGVLYNNLAAAFIMNDDYKKAIIYLEKAEKLLIKSKSEQFFFICYEAFSTAYVFLKDSDKAAYYLKKATNCAKNDYELSNVHFLKAQLNINTKDYSKALEYINKAIEIDSKINPSKLGEDFVLSGEIHNKLQNYEVSEEFINKAISLFKKTKEEENLFNAYTIFFRNFFQKNKQKQYNEYYTEYNFLSKKIDRQNNVQALFELETKYKSAEKDIQIQKEKTNTNFALVLIVLLSVLLVGGFWFYRNKQNQANLKTQNTLLSLQQSLIEAELSTLNKQLDPHEIKNLLASISPEIQEKAPESYKKMLKLFNLTKASLNSNSITDSIENQVQQIDDFLSLEKSMLPNPLDYSIENNVQNTEIQIPRLLLKNLVENAIKHGIKPTETGGNIAVKVEQKDNFIYIAVDDTGKGRQHAISLDSGIGTTTYQKLFATLNPKNKENATFEIIDKEQGTKVEVRIPVEYKYV